MEAFTDFPQLIKLDIIKVQKDLWELIYLKYITVRFRIINVQILKKARSKSFEVKFVNNYGNYDE